MELYQEEHRKALIDLNAGIGELSIKLDRLFDQYVAPPTELEVKGSVEVNTQKEVEVTNLKELSADIKSLQQTLAYAIADNSYEPLEAITVKNIKDAIPEEVKINNLQELKDYFVGLKKAIEDNQPVVNVAKQDVVFPTDPKRPVAVRLSDGKKFYEAIATAMSAAMPEVDPLAGYQICERDDAGATKYYGYAKANGAWYIMRESSTGSYRFHQRGKLATRFGDAWADRATLEYGYIYEVF